MPCQEVGGGFSPAFRGVSNQEGRPAWRWRQPGPPAAAGPGESDQAGVADFKMIWQRPVPPCVLMA